MYLSIFIILCIIAYWLYKTPTSTTTKKKKLFDEEEISKEKRDQIVTTIPHIRVRLNTIQHDILIKKISVYKEIETTLNNFVLERHIISKFDFEQIIISISILNIKQVVNWMEKVSTFATLRNIRLEIVESIIKVNPLFTPENLILDKNAMFRIKKLPKLQTNEVFLINNSGWNTKIS